MRLADVIGNWTSRAGVVRVRNVLAPLLWLLAIAMPACFLAAYFFRDDAVLKYVLIISGLGTIVSTLVAYFMFMFRDPQRLQSEEFVLRQQELTLFERKGYPPVFENSPIPELQPMPEPEALPEAKKGLEK